MMGMRSSVIGLIRRSGTTAIIGATLVATVATSSVRAANRQWENDPAQSVVVESGMPQREFSFTGNGEPLFASEGIAAGSGLGAAPADQSVAVASDEFCTACEGAGCSLCGKRAIFDLVGCRDQGNGCWIGRADFLLLWRNAPAGGAIVDNPLVPGDALSASDMGSAAAAGPRVSIIRVNKCTGNAVEATYLRAANFLSQRPLVDLGVPYVLTPPGIYNNSPLQFDTANADLSARVQSFEFNRHTALSPAVRFLAGFRWIEWQERFSLQDSLNTGSGIVSDFFQTNCINNLYGGQIGLDGTLLATRWIRFDSLVKAGVYYNNATQSSLYTTNDPLNPGTAAVSVGQSPLSGAFAGEVGLTGVIPLTCCLDFRFGYFGLWLSSIAQPTQQLAQQTLTPGQPEVGTINDNGRAFLQGVSLGLEGRW